MSNVSLSTAARLSGYSTDTIRRWIKGGLLEASKGPTTNSPWKVSEESLRRLLAAGATEGRTGEAAVVAAEPIPEALARWRTTAEEWIDTNALDELDDAARHEALLALEGLGSGGLVAALGQLRRDL